MIIFLNINKTFSAVITKFNEPAFSMKTRLLLLSFCFFIQHHLFSQCGITVDAGPDMVICSGGETINLNGQVSGANILSFSWEPPDDLSDPNSLNPSVFVSSTTTFTLTAQVFDPSNNIIPNGDFSSTTVNFTSDYIPGTGGNWGLLSNEGQYTIANNSGTTHTNFASCNDHTGGNGMLVVNGATIVGEEIWCQTIPVTPGSDYVFSAWIASVISSNPAILQFSINGSLLGSSFTASSSTCQWNQFTEGWNAGGASSAEICIVNQNTAAGGNDFAIDDLFFGPVCEQDDDVTITVIPLDAIAADEIIDCNTPNGEVQLDGSASSSGPDISYQWTTSNGNIVSGANSDIATVNQGGTYTLTVLYDDGSASCSVDTDVIVDEIATPPAADAVALDILSCANDQVQISAQGSEEGSDIDYFWTSLDGHIVIDETDFIATVEEPGIYELEVTNTNTGCTNTVTVEVFEDTTIPTIVLDAPDDIDCINTTVTINSNGSSTGPLFDYFWSTIGGNIVSGQGTPSIQVDQAGTYFLEIFNTDTGCFDEQSIDIVDIIDNPIIDIETPSAIDCYDPTTVLDAQNSSTGPEFTYQWQALDPGTSILADGNTLVPTVSGSGFFELTINNTSNGCSISQSVFVDSEIVLPDVIINNADELTCSDDFVILDATPSDIGGNFTYQWTTANGNIVDGHQTLSPEVTASGTYQLMITNLDNGCTNTGTVEVTSNTTPPLANAGTDLVIGCETVSLTLDGSLSAVGSHIEYSWNSIDGNILFGEMGVNPEVDEVGTYTIMVTNTLNGCSASDDVVVGQDTDLPVVSASVPAILNCNTSQTNLMASASASSGNFTINWTTSDGNIVSGDDSLTPLVDQAGTYNLEITDSANGCQSNIDIVVNQDVLTPVVDAGNTQTINCLLPQTDLMPTVTDQGDAAIYTWNTSNGNITNNADSLQATVDAAGTYTLTVLNPNNGCSATDSVMINANFDTPIADAGETEILNCATPSILIGGTNTSTGGNISYQWSTSNGSILSGQNDNMLSINGAGTYHLLVTNTTSGCTALDSVLITQQSDAPIASIAVNDSLTCDVTSVMIDASASSSGSTISITWSTTDGSFVGGQDSLQPSVDSPGTYTLQLTDSSNGCVSNASIEVGQNIQDPIVDAGLTDTLTCAITSLMLQPTASTQSGSIVYEWSTENGNIVGNTNNSMLTIDAPGVYDLLVIDPNNGCTANDDVIIAQDILAPTADAGNTQELNCATTSFIIGGNSSTGSQYNYQWTAISGNIIGVTNQTHSEIDAPGLYELFVINNDNGCSSLDSVLITQDIVLPTVDAGNTAILNCELTAYTLTASASMGNEFNYNWSTTDGNIVSGNTDIQATIDAPGTYVLTVNNTNNQCSNTDMVTITQDIAMPLAEAGQGSELSCTDTQIGLDASASDSGNNISYSWTTDNGNIISGDDTTMPSVNAPGVYTITVLNTTNGCSTSDDVTITQNINAPNAAIADTEVLNCNIDSIVLDASASSAGASISYSWTTDDGNISMGNTSTNPTIDQPGTYVLSVYDASNDCETITSIMVAQDIVEPTIDITPSEELTCTRLEVNIDAQNSSQNGNYTYTWSTSDGNIVSGENSLLPLVNSPGTYELLISNDDNGCSQQDELLVTQDIVVPTIEIAPTSVITCEDLTAQLNTINSSTGPAFDYLWSTNGGNITTATDATDISVDAAGTYMVFISNNINGCTNETNITVEENKVIPNADAQITHILDCNNLSVLLDGQNSSTGVNYSYTWSTDNGNIINGGNSLMPEVDQAAEYTILVRDNDNGCENEASVVLGEDFEAPHIAIADADLLTCIVEQISLNAAGSDNGTNYDLLWTTTNGNILSGETTLTPLVNQIGEYTLTIMNQDNGCDDNLNITVSENKQIPIVDTGADLEMDCIQTTIALGVNASNGSNFSYEWSSTNGTLVSGTNTASPSASSIGLYEVLVTNVDNGCSNSDEVSVFQNLINNFEHTELQPNCNSPMGTITFGTVSGGTPPYAYSIDGGQSFHLTPSFNNLETGVFPLLVQDSNGCEDESETVIDAAPELALEVEPRVTIQLGDSYFINTQITFDDSQIAQVNWTPATGLSCSDCLRPTAQPLESTNYAVDIVSVDGCTARGYIQIIVEKERNVYFPNAFSPNGDDENELFFPFAEIGQVKEVKSFSIFNRWGEEVFAQYGFQPNNPAYGWDGKFHGRTLNPAVFVYYAEIEFIDGDVVLFKGDVTLVR